MLRRFLRRRAVLRRPAFGRMIEVSPAIEARDIEAGLNLWTERAKHACQTVALA